MDKSILIESTVMSYRREGKGFPVVLIHGFGEDGDVWRHQAEALKGSYQLLIPDLPGSGASPFNHRLTTMDDFARSVKAMLDQEMVSQCILIGHSMGGYVALAFAEQFSQLLKGFGLFHSTAFADPEEKKQARRKSIEFIRTHGAEEFIASTTPNLFSTATNELRPELVRAMIDQYKSFDPRALINYYEAMIERPDRTAVLKSLKIPVLFIMGEEDKAIPLEDILKQTHLPAIADIHLFKKTGHMGMLECAEDSNEVLRKFCWQTNHIS